MAKKATRLMREAACRRHTWRAEGTPGELERACRLARQALAWAERQHQPALAGQARRWIEAVERERREYDARLRPLTEAAGRAQELIPADELEAGTVREHAAPYRVSISGVGESREVGRFLPLTAAQVAGSWRPVDRVVVRREHYASVRRADGAGWGGRLQPRVGRPDMTIHVLMCEFTRIVPRCHFRLTLVRPDLWVHPSLFCGCDTHHNRARDDCILLP